MALAPQTTFAPIGEILARQILPRLRLAAKLPLRVICIGTASYVGADDADSFDRNVALGDRPSLEDATSFAALSVRRGGIGVGADETLRFHPRLVVIQDNDQGLVLAGEIRAGIILWQQPVASDSEARRIVTEASRLRGIAFAASSRGDHNTARNHRHQASLLEACLVDPFWREAAADLLRLPQAA
ncbi:hypothetical protein [Enterovirga aerilata]|jgi:hypothetical protein|uniref:Uncharacterized protein n=1 Tax=Enterovirga aerilata TaxID=2730920 RepID=A0A849IAX7_9HYPH|nr:hypothetical protein [Enterovirga sp. DB1703]NNM73200.1 hypothetical protein [Enterovirga sp. DB1703]